MTDNVVKFPGITTVTGNAPDVLRAIADDNPSKVFVICWPEDGTMPTYHSNTSDMPVVLMRIQEFIHKFYNGDFN